MDWMDILTCTVQLYREPRSTVPPKMKTNWTAFEYSTVRKSNCAGRKWISKAIESSIEWDRGSEKWRRVYVFKRYSKCHMRRGNAASRYGHTGSTGQANSPTVKSTVHSTTLNLYCSVNAHVNANNPLSKRRRDEPEEFDCELSRHSPARTP